MESACRRDQAPAGVCLCIHGAALKLRLIEQACCGCCKVRGGGGLNEVQADSRTDACSSRCRRHVGPWRVRVTETEPFTVHRSPCIVSHRHCSIEQRSCPLDSTKHNGTAALSSHCSLVWTGPSATAPPSQISTAHHSAQINWRPCPRHRQITESADSSVNIQTLSIAVAIIIPVVSVRHTALTLWATVRRENSWDGPANPIG